MIRVVPDSHSSFDCSTYQCYFSPPWERLPKRTKAEQVSTVFPSRVPTKFRLCMRTTLKSLRRCMAFFLIDFNRGKYETKALERSSSASSCDTVKRVTCTYSLLLLLPTPTRRDACYQYRRAVITRTFIFVFSTPRSHAFRLSVHNPTAALNEPPTSRLATLRIHDLRSTRNHLNIDYNVIARTLRERLKATLRTNP